MKAVNYITTPAKMPQYRLNEKEKLVCGDLHGNFIKLLDYMIICNFININETIYLDIINEFTTNIFIKPIKSQLDMEKYKRYSDEKIKNVLSKIKFNESSNELILLGDVFGDRNSEDLLKLELIKVLNKKTNNKLVITYGNHDNAALNILSNRDSDCCPCISDFLNLTKKDKKEIKKDFMDVVKQNFVMVKIIDNYFFSHTPIRLDVFNSFKDKNRDNYNFNQIVKDINKYFKQNNDSDKKNQTFLYLIWDRYNKGNMYLKDEYEDIIQVCGHDTFKDDKNRLFSLNNLNGKASGIYNIETLLII